MEEALFPEICLFMEGNDMMGQFKSKSWGQAGCQDYRQLRFRIRLVSPWPGDETGQGIRLKEEVPS